METITQGCEVEKKGEAFNESAILNDAITGYENIVRRLEEKLDAVLAPPSPQVEEKQEVKTVNTKLGQEILNHSDRVLLINRQFNQIIGRIDL